MENVLSEGGPNEGAAYMESRLHYHFEKDNH